VLSNETLHLTGDLGNCARWRARSYLARPQVSVGVRQRKMIIRDGSQSSLDITVREPGLSGAPVELDLGLNVIAICGTFSGRNDDVWVRRLDWNQFARSVAELEQTRRGEAIVSAMSPNDFHLRIFASDRAGHIMAEGWVGRAYSARGGILENRVSFGIEIDPTILSLLAQQFESLSPAV
jgi:hypothetical protein